MAIEAVSQRAKARGGVYSMIKIRELSISQALVIPETEDVETIFSLRPLEDGTKTCSITWDEFRVFSWTSNRGWIEHCIG